MKDVKKIASRYVKIVEWSEEDQCFVGLCPELFFAGTHGSDEARVYADLTAIVEDVVAGLMKQNKLPAPKVAASYSGKFLLRTGPALHKALSIRALREGKSLNQVCLEALKLGPVQKTQKATA